MKIEIEISDEEIKALVTEKVTNQIAELIVGERYAHDKNLYKRTIAEAVRDVIYKDKANIVDRVVAQTSREVRSKALKALVELGV